MKINLGTLSYLLSFVKYWETNILRTCSKKQETLIRESAWSPGPGHSYQYPKDSRYQLWPNPVNSSMVPKYTPPRLVPSKLLTANNKKRNVTLAGVAQWIEHRPASWKVASLIPSQGSCLYCGPGPQLGCVRGNQWMYLSYTDVSLPFFLLPSPLSKNT